MFSTPSSTFGPKSLLQKPYYDGKRNEDITDKLPNGEEIATKLKVSEDFISCTSLKMCDCHDQSGCWRGRHVRF